MSKQQHDWCDDCGTQLTCMCGTTPAPEMPASDKQLSDAKAIQFIEVNNLELEGRNPDPRGLGGAGGTKYRYKVTNAYENAEPNLPVFVGTGHTIAAALEGFQKKAKEYTEKLRKEREGIDTFVSRLAGEHDE